MKGRDGNAGLSAADLEFLGRWNISKWCNINDPVAQNAVWKARTKHFRKNSDKELEEWVDTLDRQLAEGWEKVQFDDEGNHNPDYYRGMVNGEHTWDRPDSVDLLLRLHELGNWGNKDPKRKEKKTEYPVEDAEELLHLLCLCESKRGNFGLAIKAYLFATSERARRALEDAGLARKKGGKNPKRLEAIFEATKEIVSRKRNQNLNAPSIWAKIPEETDARRITLDDGAEYDVYRDVHSADPVDPQSEIHQQKLLRTPTGGLQQGEIKSVRYSSWRAYVTMAKKELAKK